MLAAHVQFAKNLKQFRGMLADAQAIAPKKFRGYTVAELSAQVNRLEALVLMSDDAMRAHLSSIGSARVSA